MTNILLSPADLGSQLATELERCGVRAVTWPKLRIDAPENCFGLDEAIENLFGYDWLVLKNEQAATSLLDRFQTNHQLYELDDLKTLAIGDPTSEILVQSNIHVDVAIDRFSSEKIFAALAGYAGDLTGLTFLLPSAGLNCELFEQRLTEAGARVDNVTAYRTTSENQRLSQLMALLLGGGIDGVVFTNPAELDEFRQLVDTDDLSRLLAGVTVVCGDPETARGAREFGMSANIVVPEMLLTEAISNLLNAPG